MKKQLPHLRHEKKLWKEGYYVLGIDEVGRGAFAGPLVLGGVIFPPTRSQKKIKALLSYGINDSKKLKYAERKIIDKTVKKEAFAHIYVSISVGSINSVGIGKATFIGIRKLVKKIKERYPEKNFYLLLDAFYCKYVNGVGLKHQKALVKGDSISLSIAAASIIAKVKRDQYMKNLAKKYPKYGFENHVGYGTAAHRNAIRQFGPSHIHRIDFIQKTVRELTIG